jgi:hypothetical protein
MSMALGHTEQKKIFSIKMQQVFFKEKSKFIYSRAKNSIYLQKFMSMAENWKRGLCQANNSRGSSTR